MSSSTAFLQRPLITAHTGCEGTVENSLVSIVTGIEAGADAVEVDVRATADGFGVLLHDPEIRLKGGECVPVGKLSLDDLRRIERSGQGASNGENEPAVLLDDALALARDHNVIINLDVKDDPSVSAVVRAVEDFELTEQVVISGCSRARAAAVTAFHPGLRVLLNTASVDAGVDDRGYRRFLMQTYHDAVGAGCCGINIDYRMCRDSLVRFAHQRFLPVSVWTVNTVEEMAHMAKLGVFAITTYKPRLLLRVLVQAA